MIEISIIVPIYNSAGYVQNCLDSIIHQTYTDWQLILVDDGSTDGAAEICDEYAAKDKRISVIHQENKGVSAARNIGIDKAVGRYIMFLDGDDMLNISTLEKLMAIRESTDSDIVTFQLKKVYGSSIDDAYEKLENIDFEVKTQQETILRKLDDDFISAVASLYDSSIIKKNNVKFDETLYYCEDALFYFSCVLHAQKIAFTDAALYLYVQNEQSAVHSALPYFKIKTELEGWYKIKDLISGLGNSNILTRLAKRIDEVTYHHVIGDINNYCNDYDTLSEGERQYIINLVRRNMKIRYMKRNVVRGIKAYIFMISPKICRNIYMKHKENS